MWKNQDAAYENSLPPANPNEHREMQQAACG